MQGTLLEKRVGRPFFERYTPFVAKDLLGKSLVRILNGVRLSGLIVEAEAYRGMDDPASHAHRGVTKRNAVMFGEPGFSYVYLSYGANWCLNLTTERRGRPGAVLIRALEPREGIATMRVRRGLEEVEELTNGPGKLTKALGINKELNSQDLILSRRLYLAEVGNEELEIGVSPRIGVGSGSDKRWRYFVKWNRFVSKARPS
jgi:DNA-3-methyladenine glycosylase